MRRPSLVFCASVALLSSSCAAEGSGLGGGGGRGSDGGPIATIDTGPSDVPLGMEVCGDEIDNTGDGLVDEGCPCLEGEVKPCWPGAPTRRGIGACHDGLQYCEAFGEFMAWGECIGAQVPAGEVADNCVDEDCDGAAPGCTSGCDSEFEACGPDGRDEDCDGRVDCEDSDCADAPACASACVPDEFGERCTGGEDEDCDGRIDCADSDCSSHSSCRMDPPPPPGCTAEFPFFVEIRCGDGRDNDCDGRIDCMDPDCRSPGNCGCAATETMCSNGTDDDCDGSSDCSDTECQRCTPGTSRWCDDPVYCHWGRQECQPDGSWGACVETMDRPSGCTSTLYSRDCCVTAGECCQNYPVDDLSVGNCSSIVTCT
jgi:hypothetical protein